MSLDWAQATGARRSCHDTEAERRPVKPELAPPMVGKKSENSTGFTSQIGGLLTQDVMERAVADRMAEAEADYMGYNAKAGDTEDAAAQEEEREEDQDKDGAAVREDDDLEALRARRREQMKKGAEKRQKYIQLGHGLYSEIAEEEFLKTVTSSERCIVHFYHRGFERCKIMDMHLSKCAKKFFGTRFVKLNSEKAPFFVEKLRVKCLPCIVVFNDGVALDRQVGFDGLPGDEFTSGQLAWRLKEMGGMEEDFGPDDEIES